MRNSNQLQFFRSRIESNLKGQRRYMSPEQSPHHTHVDLGHPEHKFSPYHQSDPKLNKSKYQQILKRTKRQQILSQLVSFNQNRFSHLDNQDGEASKNNFNISNKHDSSHNNRDQYNLAYIGQIGALERRKNGKNYFSRNKEAYRGKIKAIVNKISQQEEEGCVVASQSTQIGANITSAIELGNQELHYEMVLAQQKCKKLTKD